MATYQKFSKQKKKHESDSCIFQTTRFQKWNKKKKMVCCKYTNVSPIIKLRKTVNTQQDIIAQNENITGTYLLIIFDENINKAKESYPRVGFSFELQRKKEKKS